MRARTGCLTLAGAVTAVLLSTGMEAEAACTAVVAGHDEVDNVSNYGASCPSGTVQGVCLKSIKTAISCAGSFFATAANQSNNYTLTVGTGGAFNADLSQDTSLGTGNPAQTVNPFDINFTSVPTGGHSCSTSPQGGCLIVQGASTSGNMTLTTAPGPHGVFIHGGTSHVLFQHMTLRQPAETMAQGVFVSSGTYVLSTASNAGTFATLTLDMLEPAVTTPILNAANFASIASGGTAYGPSNTFTVTLALPSGCSQAAQLSVSTNTAQVITSINSIVQRPICTTYPRSATPVSSSGGAGSGATFYVAYVPSPLSEFNNNVNSYAAQTPSSGAFTTYLQAYTNASTPAAVPITPGTTVRNWAQWGSLRYNGTYTFKPPELLNNSPPYRWKLTFSEPLTTTPVPTYFSNTSNLVCLHRDFGTAFYVDNAAAGGTDILINDVYWTNVSRSVFLGTPGVQVTGGGISRDPTTYSSPQLPCYSSENGGLQFSQPDKAATYGNQVTNFTADAIADDSIAMYNDIGGRSGNAQSNIISSTITNAAAHPIRLYNNSSITGIADTTPNTMVDTGNCGIPSSGSGSGSPVCVDTATITAISSSNANCDTNFWNRPTVWGSICPIFYDYSGLTGIP